MVYGGIILYGLSMIQCNKASVVSVEEIYVFVQSES